MRDTSRRTFLKTAGVLAAANAVACNDAPRDTSAPVSVARITGFDKPLIDALGEAVLPESLGVDGRKTATAAFVAWMDGYDPVAEEMHGYGYADIRYLPPDPAPAWRAQLAGLDILARRSRARGFAELDVAGRRELLAIVLRGNRGDRLPAPLSASHVAVALLSHWAASPAAHDLAMGVRVTPLTCRPLRAAIAKPAAST
ncbi:MAG: gluconate 2-dehydrogenase subunit 3 family protein [Gemmatimonadota bacterium]|nr:gluconate 2-dehydrogenase subunit 3 family protein [Gemmatimonadota bacterium]